MRTSRPREAGTAAGRQFWLYVEGPRDHEVLRGWARACWPGLLRPIESAAVILGGRRPARAVEHFRRMGAPGEGLRGVCVLDRDGETGEGGGADAHAVPGLAFFTWGRRHIESYLLDAAAIRRGLRMPRGDGRLERILRERLPEAGDEALLREVDAKRLLGPGGPLARDLGRSVPLGRIARAMQEREIHADVHRLFEVLREAMGLPATEHVLK